MTYFTKPKIDIAGSKIYYNDVFVATINEKALISIKEGFVEFLLHTQAAVDDDDWLENNGY